jgi:hypothetical protein
MPVAVVVVLVTFTAAKPEVWAVPVAAAMAQRQETLPLALMVLAAVVAPTLAAACREGDVGV